MKKFNAVLMSVLTIVLTSVLAACSFKKVEASFSLDELAISQTETINLDDYLSVAGVDLEEVDFGVSNSSVLQIEGHTLSAKAIGKATVYASYNQNQLASMNIVVKDVFSTPSGVSLSEGGLLTWQAVSGVYGDQTVATNPAGYLIEGEFVPYYSDDEVGETTPISVTTQECSLQLEEGRYSLSITALGNGYFDDSQPSPLQNFYVGFMEQLTADSFTWNDGVLTWDAIAGATYRVRFDDVVLEEQQTTSKDLTSQFESASAGEHFVSVVVYDAEGDKFAMQSEVLTITKLDTPTATFANGQIEISSDADVAEYAISATNLGDETFDLEVVNNAETLTNTLDGLTSGVYSVSVVAKNESSANGLFFHSDSLSLGQAYKLDAPIISGTGNNEVDGTILSASVSSRQVPVGTSFEVSGATLETPSGLEANGTQTDVDFVLSTAGTFELSVRQIALEQTYLEDGQTINVINSDFGESVSVTKVSAFSSEIVHQYGDTASILSFENVVGATEYELQRWNGEEFVAVPTENYDVEIDSTVQIVLTDRVENLFAQTDGEFRFVVIAKTEDDNLAINSSEQKVLRVLTAPTSEGSGNTTNLEYTFGEVENATSYRLEIYTLTKEQFDEEEFDPSSLVPERVDEESNSHTFEREGYYLVRVFAISDNENEFVSAKDSYLEEKFRILKQLELGEVQFGYDEARDTDNLTETTGYFVQISRPDADVTAYRISVGEDFITPQATEQDQNIFLLPSNFASGQTTLTIVGTGEDDDIYLSTTPFELNVSRLADVAFADLVVDDFWPTSTITLPTSSGVRAVEIYDEVGQTNHLNDNGDVSVSVAGEEYSSFSMRFRRYGTAQDDFTKFFQIDGDTVYLNSNQTTIAFQRLDRPTNFQYYDGDLTFQHTNVTATTDSTGAYVLELVCTTPNSSQNISVRFFANEAVAIPQGLEEISLGQTSTFLSTEGNAVTIDLQLLLETMQEQQSLVDIISQSVSIQFRIYAHQSRMLFGSNHAELSSPYGTTNTIGDDETLETILTVEKMSGTNLSLQVSGSTYTLVWDEVEAESSVARATTYQIFNANNPEEPVGEREYNNIGFNLTSISSGDTYFVRATNPYYLDSVDSNLVVVNRLSGISQISLNDGNIVFNIPSAESNVIEHVQIVVETDSLENLVLENTTGTFEIPRSGTYTFTVIGRTITNYDSENEEEVVSIVYYLNSPSNTFTVSEMSTQAPSNTSLTIQNNTISWEVFAENLGASLNSLEYVLMFRDESGHVGTYITTSNSVNWMTDETLRATLDILDEGNITVALYAHLRNYAITQNGTLFYLAETTLLDDATGFNYFTYTDSESIRKLTTPNVESVELENSTAYEYTLTPDIVVTFSGNYGVNGEFAIFREGTDEQLEVEVNYDGEQEGVYTYSFTLTSAQYDNYFTQANSTLTFSIYALSSGDNSNAFPSTSETLTFERADNLNSVSFLPTSEGSNFSSKVVGVEFDDARQLLGGAGLIVTTKVGDVTDEIFVHVESVGELSLTHDLSNVIDTSMTQGGSVRLSAFVYGYADAESETYILPSVAAISSENYTVLRQVTEANITTNTTGFTIENVNNVDTIYVVEASVNQTPYTYQVSSADNFTFTIPNAWNDGQYSFTVTAIQKNDASENFLASAESAEIGLSVNRIASISEVTLSRGSDMMQTLSWTPISGATGYIINVYSQDGEELLLSKSDIASSYTLEEIFGEDYSELNAVLDNDLPVLIQIVTLGGEGQQISKAYSFNATIRSNEITASEIGVDEFGLISVATQSDKEYLYRLVSGAGEVLRDWTVFDQIDTTTIDTDLSFNLEIKVLGFGTSSGSSTTSTGSNFVLDSSTFSTANSPRTFYKVYDVVSVGRDLQYSASDLTIVLEDSATSLIYVGLNEDALLSHQVASFKPTFIEAQGSEFIYTFSLAEIVDLLRDAGVTIENSNSVTLCFWAYKTTETENITYLSSGCYDGFSFNFNQDVGFEEFVKLGEYDVLGAGGTPTGEQMTDYVNTYVTFANDPQAIGIYVNITTQYEDGEPFEYTSFVSRETLISHTDKFDSDHYVINLLDVFDESQVRELSGTFNLRFAKLSLVDGALAMSDWCTSYDDGRLFTIQRLQPTSALNINYGNLSWDYGGENTEEYYVYFQSSLVDDSYTYFQTTRTTFNASEFSGPGTSYYIAVQGISKNALILSSQKVFRLDDMGQPLRVYKNQMNSPLTLKDGTLVINWTEGDFMEDFMDDATSPSSVVETLLNTTYTAPFTFSLTNLLNGNIYLNLKFTRINEDSLGMAQTFRVNVATLLASLSEYIGEVTLDARLDELAEATVNVQGQTMINNLRILATTGSFGVANHNTIFDSIFESLQAGKYQLEYCLTESSHTLNSVWYTYENTEGVNEIYVNTQPNLNVAIVSDRDVNGGGGTNAINHFKMVISKSIIQTSSTTSETASNYVMKVGNDAYAISLDTHSLSKIGADGGNTVSVYESDASGNVVSSGNYLMFYLNQNNGNSLLGVYGEGLDELSSQELQVYAVGNDYSISSKSELFHITFLGFANFSINDGVFGWTTQNNLPTSVVFRPTDNLTETEVLINPSEEDQTMQFGLEGSSAGTYNLQFVVKGSVRDNMILVDSEIYTTDVYKLNSPSLSNTRGNLQITAPSGNVSQLQNIYTDNGKFNYQITNNSAEGLTYSIYDSTNTSIAYEVGTTGLPNSTSTENPDYYNLKVSEELATSFSATALGTTAQLTIEDIAGAGNYYLKQIRCVISGTEEVSAFGIGIKSETATISASMMDAVGNIRVENGLLTWDAVTGRSVNETLTVPETSHVVYKLTISKYDETYTETGTTQTIVGDSIIRYTALTTFDFATLPEDEQVDAIAPYIKVTVQALTLNVEQFYTGTRVSLVEGGYGYGNLQYAGTERYILMGNGGEIDGISRLSPIDDDSLQVVDGNLTWKYTVPTYVDSSNFMEYYSFIVTDNDGKEIGGNFTFQEGDGAFDVTFTANDGEMKTGTYPVSIYVNQGTGNPNVVIKSYARSKEITKLETITYDDFVIESDIQFETLVVEVPNPNYEVVATRVDTEDTFVFTSSQNKLFIFRTEPTEEVIYPEGYLTDYLVIADSDNVQLRFQVRGEGVLYSDMSEEFNLHRTSWDEGSAISWDGTSQQFSWEFDYYSFNGQTSAQVVGADGELGETVTLDASQMFTVSEWGEEVSTILYDGTTYQVSTSSIVSPTFIVSATYGNGVQRTYTTTEKVFTPTITGEVSISVRIKINDTNLQSTTLQSETHNFNLFASGDGTSTNPYRIETEEQFRNIAHRMVKDEMLTTFIGTSTGTEGSEEEQFYFVLATDLNLEFDGVLFTGEFGGVLESEEDVVHTLTFVSTDVGALTSAITISEQDTKIPLSQNVGSLTYSRGTSIFEKLASSAEIRNLNIDATFGTTSTEIGFHSLMAGLAITNSGTIENVNLDGFESNFLGNVGSTRTAMAYSGIVSTNYGLIYNCSAQTDMTISDGSLIQSIFVSGIVYTNYDRVENCVSGLTGQEISILCQHRADAVQVAGIAITNTSSATIQNCTNNFDIYVECAQSDNSVVCYMAGIVAYGKGRVNGTNNGALDTRNISAITGDGIIATTT